MHKQTGSKGCFRCLVGLYRLALILLSLSLPSVAQAQSTIPSLAPNLADSAPDTYVVQQGDTLWDISALFLDEPWRWPELWSVNPDVRDPNLIYPGDVLYLRWDKGTPGVYLSDRPRVGVTKLSPKIRTRPLVSAISEIPRDVIDPFIAYHRFETELDTSRFARVLGGADGRLIFGLGDSVYVAGNLESDITHYDVVRLSERLTDPVTGEVLGQLLVSVGRVALSRAAANQREASRFDVIGTREEIRAGDVLLPVYDGEVVSLFKPRAPDKPVTSGAILYVDGGVSQIGALDVVATNLGRVDGAEVGHILSITKQITKMRDPETGEILSLPVKPAGTLMLFSVHDQASFGLVLAANQPLAVGDALVDP